MCASNGISACGRRGYPLRRYARLVGAPNCAPSLCSVAGLLLALALQSAYEGALPPSLSSIGEDIGAVSCSACTLVSVALAFGLFRARALVVPRSFA